MTGKDSTGLGAGDATKRANDPAVARRRSVAASRIRIGAQAMAQGTEARLAGKDSTGHGAGAGTNEASAA